MWKLRRPTWRHAALFAALVAAAYGVAYALAVNGEPYEFARQFVAEDSRVIQVTGAQRKQSLGVRQGWSYTFGDRQGDASLTVRVEGAQGHFDIPLVLDKRDGRWSVRSASAVDEHGNAVAIIPQPLPGVRSR